MNESSRYGGSHIFLAFLAGAVAGAAVALLTAPQSGRDTRDQVRGWAKDMGQKAAKLPRAAQAAYGRAADAAKTAFQEALREEGTGEADA